MILTKEQIKFYYKNVLRCKVIFTLDNSYSLTHNTYLYIYKCIDGDYAMLENNVEPEENEYRIFITNKYTIYRYFKIKEILE